MALSTLISFQKFSRQLFAFSLCCSGLNSALLVLSTIYLFIKVTLSPDIILCGWLGLAVIAFSLCARILGECLTIHTPFALFKKKWRLAHANLFHSLGQDQSTVAQRAEMTVTECSLMSCLWACFLVGSHTMPGQQHSQPTRTLLDQRCMCI